MKINSVNCLNARVKITAGVNPVDRMLEIAERDDDTSLYAYYQAIEDLKGKDFAAKCVIEALEKSNFYEEIVSEYNEEDYGNALTSREAFFDLTVAALDDGRSYHREANNIASLIEFNDKIYEVVHQRFCELVKEKDTY